MRHACIICGAISDQTRCEDHRLKPWETSTRRQRTISGGAQQKRAGRIMRQHHGICHICGQAGAEEVDHVIPLAEGGDDDDHNLRPAHKHCHRTKTLQEAARARHH